EIAVTTGDADAVTSAIANGGDVNRRTSKGSTLIISALDDEKLDIATILAENGADLTTQGLRNYLVVTAAVKAEHLEIVDKAIKDMGLEINDPITPSQWNLL